MKRSTLTKDGEKVLHILQNEYQMGKETALKLMQDCGAMFAVALLTRGKK